MPLVTKLKVSKKKFKISTSNLLTYFGAPLFLLFSFSHAQKHFAFKIKHVSSYETHTSCSRVYSPPNYPYPTLQRHF